jgi:predicted component of type VI protein secretion system
VAENKETNKKKIVRKETKELLNTTNHEEARKRKRCNNGPVR